MARVALALVLGCLMAPEDPNAPPAPPPAPAFPEPPAPAPSAGPPPAETSSTTRWGRGADAVPWRMTLDELLARGACREGLETFDARTEGRGVWTLEEGWTHETTLELARSAPRSLKWYARQGLIPVSLEEAREAIRDAEDEAARQRGPLGAVRASRLVPRARGALLHAIHEAERIQ